MQVGWNKFDSTRRSIDLLNKTQQHGGTPPTDDNDVDFEEVK